MSVLEEEDKRSLVEYEDELKHEPEFWRERAEGPRSGDDL